MNDDITTYKLKLTFAVTPTTEYTSSKRTWTITQISDTMTDQQVQAVINAFVANGSIFAGVPTEIVEAYREATTKHVYEQA